MNEAETNARQEHKRAIERLSQRKRRARLKASGLCTQCASRKLRSYVWLCDLCSARNIKLAKLYYKPRGLDSHGR